jgi:hypothetical protein
LGVKVSQVKKKLPILQVGRHGFLGLSELFTETQRRFGAHCSSKSVVYLRLSLG